MYSVIGAQGFVGVFFRRRRRRHLAGAEKGTKGVWVNLSMYLYFSIFIMSKKRNKIAYKKNMVRVKIEGESFFVCTNGS